jgi:hypothetical protein
MSDVHGAAYLRTSDVDGSSGNLPWQGPDNYGGYGGAYTCMESMNDGDNDTDDIGTYSPLPTDVPENQAYGTGRNGFITGTQRGYDSGGGWN